MDSPNSTDESDADLDYGLWLIKMGVDLEAEKNRYDNYTEELERALCESDFWRHFGEALGDAGVDYERSTQHQLFMPGKPLRVFRKPWSSYLEKTERKNRRKNAGYPKSPPDGGWVLPGNFSAITDVLRTNIVVRYLDGVKLIALAVEVAADRAGLIAPEVCPKNSLEGYYALHVDLTVRLRKRSPTERGIEETGGFPLEIQISTQMQDVLRELTHVTYEKRRLGSSAADWPWDHQCEEFTPNLLGHILQYVDGTIMQVRDRSVET